MHPRYTMEEESDPHHKTSNKSLGSRTEAGCPTGTNLPDVTLIVTMYTADSVEIGHGIYCL